MKDTVALWFSGALVLIAMVLVPYNMWVCCHLRKMRQERMLAEFRARLYAETEAQYDHSAARGNELTNDVLWERKERADYEVALREWIRLQFRTALYDGTVGMMPSPEAVGSSGTRSSWTRAEKEAFLAALHRRQREEFLAAACARTSDCGNVAVIQLQDDCARSSSISITDAGEDLVNPWPESLSQSNFASFTDAGSDGQLASASGPVEAGTDVQLASASGPVEAGTDVQLASASGLVEASITSSTEIEEL